jgi:glycogen debranching enzyme
MVGGEMLLQLRVEPEQARKTLPAIVMSLNMESEKKAREIYRNVLARARELYESRVKYHKDFLARTLSIETPDAELNRAFTWAKVAIDAGWVCHEKMGCGLVAGYGPAGDYERPGFAWWFGGDALMASWAMLDYGDTSGALQVLRFLKARQRADGKMMHEMTQSVDLVDWFGKYGFAYYHADTTPLYIYSVGEYWRRTGDKKFLEEFWPSVKRAYEWCLTTVDPADGLMDNTKAGLAAVEVGPLRGKVTKDIYLEGFWLAALQAMSEIADVAQDFSVRNASIDGARKALDSLRSNWWNAEGSYYAFGVTAEGKRIDMLGSWPAVLHALRSIEMIDEDLSDGVEVLARPELNTDWGLRWLSNKDSLYDPLSYNNGGVWPFIGGFAAQAFYNYGGPLQGYAIWAANARLTGSSSPGALPELLTGDFYRPMERAVPHQLFSSVAVVIPAVEGLLGLSIGATDWNASSKNDVGDSNKPLLTVAPAVPAPWKSLRFSKFAIGENSLNGEIWQQPGKLQMRLEYDGSEPRKVHVSPTLPTGATVRRVLVNNKVTKFDQDTANGLTFISFDSMLAENNIIEVQYEGGVGIVVPEPKPQLGDRTSALKVVRIENNVEESPREMNLWLAGLGGRTYTLDLVTTEKTLTAEGATVKKTESGYRLGISFAGPENEYVTKQIRLRW